MSGPRPSDLPTAARALWWSSVARVLINTRGFPRAALRLGFAPVDAVDLPVEDPMLPERTRRAVRVALRALGPKALRVTCLPRAIALHRVLRARGVEADLLLGGLRDGKFAAHAWIEVSGTPIGYGEPGTKQWRSLARFRAVRAVAPVRPVRAEAAEV